MSVNSMIGNKNKKIIEDFCEEIKHYYWSFLCKKKPQDFPFCCKESADLVTSFFNAAFGGGFEYIATTRPGAFNHAWTYGCIENEEFIIDFTAFQFDDREMCDKIRFGEVTENEKAIFLDKQKIVFDINEKQCHICYEFMMPKTIPFHGNVPKYKGALNKESFITYVQENFDIVKKNTYYE